jgi:mannosyl-oligosaccharide glucosidase
LSLADENYGKDEDYWRGAVWMNLNVLAVQQLNELGKVEGPERTRAQTLAAELRKRVVNTAYDSWKKTGFVWEQYSDTTGEGRRSRAFTGWTACVILLMGLDVGGNGREEMDSKRVAGTPEMVIALFLVLLIFVFRRRVITFWRTASQRLLTRRRLYNRDAVYEQVIDFDEEH